MKAIKKNKEYTIDEVQKDFYVKSGYDIYGEDGEVIAYGKGKTIPYEDYLALKKEYEEAEGVADDEDVKAILQAYASEHQVDLGQASTVKGYVKKIVDAGVM